MERVPSACESGRRWLHYWDAVQRTPRFEVRTDLVRACGVALETILDGRTSLDFGEAIREDLSKLFIHVIMCIVAWIRIRRVGIHLYGG